MSMEEWSVYKHTAPNGKVYIGVTHVKPKYRWGKNGNGYRTNAHFSNAIRKYGWDNIRHDILFTGLSQAQAEEKETELIAAYDSANPKYGYNVALGGHALSEKSRKQISETRKQRGIKPWCTGKHHSEETRRKLSEARKGKSSHPWTEEQKQRARESKLGANNPNYGKPMREECRLALLEANEKPVVQLIGTEKVRYKSAKAAGDATGVNNTNITRCCKGQRTTAGGFRWSYAE